MLFQLFRKIAFLKDISLFRGLSENYLIPLARMSRSETLKKGECLFHQGDPGDAIYCICQGSISVQIDNLEVGRLGDGDCFGEMAILDGAPRSASCLALGDSELLKFSETDLEIILKSQTSVALALLKMLARKLHRQTRNTIQREGASYSGWLRSP